jgi:glutamyl-tRNA synthetase
MNALPVRTRIAPTPSGFLHLGNLFSFVLTWLIAKSKQGIVILRIDDLDAVRAKKEYVEDIFKSLDFIGLQPDVGPSGTEDFFRNYSQQQRMDDYQHYLTRLKDADCLYACQCSRRQVHQQNERNIYGGNCRHLGLDFEQDSVAWRFKLVSDTIVSFHDNYSKTLRQIDVTQQMGDFVMRRKDKLPAYQIASIVDDLQMGINLVVRGEDLLSSTAAQLQVSYALKEPVFSAISWYHHILVKNELQEKLSKSAGHSSIKWMIEHGFDKNEILKKIGKFCGLPDKNYGSLSNLLNEYGQMI